MLPYNPLSIINTIKTAIASPVCIFTSKKDTEKLTLKAFCQKAEELSAFYFSVVVGFGLGTKILC